jgi:Spy/CpxP family protein refolding chaperone
MDLSVGGKTMKRSISILALSALVGVAAAIGAPQEASAPAQQDKTAQTGVKHASGRRHADPQQQVQRLAKRLQLTSEQQSQLLPILSQRTERAKAIRNDSTLSATDRRAKLRDLRQESEAQIKNVLTDTQKQQYDAMVQQRRSHMKRHEAGTASAS